MRGARLVLAFAFFVAVLSVFVLTIDDHKASAAPTTYYVSFSSGNDSNNGTSPSTPWKTLTKASAVTLNPGDSLLLKAGDTWTGDTLLPKGSGTAAAPILISSYGTGAQPHIAPGIGVKTYGIRLVNVAGYKITNLEISDTYGGIVAWYDQSYNHDYLWIENVYLHDITGKDTGFTTVSTTPAVDLYYGAGISLAGADGIGNQTFLSNITIKNSTFIRCDDGILMVPRDATSYTAQNKSLITANAFKNVNISNVTVKQSYRSAGIALYCINGGSLTDSFIDETGYQVGMWWGVAALQLSRVSNFTANNLEIMRSYRSNGSPDGEGIDFEADNHNVTVSNIYIHDLEGPALLYNPGPSNVWGSTNSNITVDSITIKNVNTTMYGGNIAFYITANNSGMIKNSNLFLQNDSQTYATSPIVFDSSNNVWNSTVQVVNDSATGTGTNQFDYASGTWAYGSAALGYSCTGCLYSDEHYSNTTNGYYLVRFNGTRIQVRNGKGPQAGIAAFSVDGGPETLVDLYNPTLQQNVLTYTSPTLTSGSHTLKVRVTGTKNAGSTGYYVGADMAIVSQGGTASPTHVGLDTVGANAVTSPANHFIAMRAVAGANVTATDLNLYVASGATGTALLGIYSDNAGHPGTLLAQTSAITLANGWNTGTITPTSLTAGTPYWLVYNLSATGSVLKANTVTGGDQYIPYAYGSLPATAPGGLAAGNDSVSFYASAASGTTHVGLDTVGSNSYTSPANYFIANKAVAGSNVTVNKLNLYVASGATGSARLGIYSDSAGHPGTLLAQTSAITLANGWNIGAIPATSLTAGTQYWLVYNLSATGSVLRGNTVASGDQYYPSAYGSLPATAPGGLVTDNDSISIFASN